MGFEAWKEDITQRRADYFACSWDRATAEVLGDDDEAEAGRVAECEARDALPRWARWGGWLPR
jgi:hypothetical protein